MTLRITTWGACYSSLFLTSQNAKTFERSSNNKVYNNEQALHLKNIDLRVVRVLKRGRRVTQHETQWAL